MRARAVAGLALGLAFGLTAGASSASVRIAAAPGAGVQDAGAQGDEPTRVDRRLNQAFWRLEPQDSIPAYDLWHSYLADGLTLDSGVSMSFWKFDPASAPRDSDGRQALGIVAFGMGKAAEFPVVATVWVNGANDISFADKSEGKFAKNGALIVMNLSDYACRERIVCDRGEVPFRISPDGKVSVNGAVLGVID